MARALPVPQRWQLLRFTLSPAQSLLAGFAAVIVLGGVLLSLPVASETGQPTPFLTALFTANSAVCVTGLVVVDTADHYSTFGELVILALIQIGGFGYMTSWALLALLLGWRIGLRERIVLTEAHGLYRVGGVVRFTRRIVALALIVEAVGAALLTLRFAAEMPLGRAAYLGVFHSISAFNNAGFDLMGGFRSLTAYVADPAVSLLVAALVITGGLGFVVLFDLLGRRLSFHSRAVLVTTAALLGGGTLAILGLEYANARTLGALPWPARVLAAFFQAVTPRTAGFNTVEMGALTQPTLMLLVALMFIGASPGGTGGGIKTTTFLTPLAVIVSTIRGSPEPVLFRRRLPAFVIHKAVTIAFLAVAFVFTMTVLLTRVEGADLLPSLFEVTSAFGTVGLSTGLTPRLSALGRVIIMVTMFTGRVGLLTLAFGLTRRERPVRIRYPEERLYIG
ncbi:MAG: TrkH family potassium uptake protein [Armatimonadota bacterium]|nr:TrkH family potassium uptake protein [Armatimonadota bacterium]MDR7532918.1 TrkH family potassium uptake protein [Armatimonadota bacterium]MDR7536125.1 TrkH family potassium uptake protein [Armatimonadota bacterium]